MRQNISYLIDESRIDFIKKCISTNNINFCLNSLLKRKNWLLRNWELEIDIESYQSWFSLKNRERTYWNIDIWNSFLFIEDKLHIENELFNVIFQVAISDLLEDVLNLKLLNNIFVKNCKIYMTDNFDYLSSGVEYILNITTDDWDRFYWYTINFLKNDIAVKPQKVICKNFNLSSWNNNLIIDAYNIKIGDSNFLFEYLSNYIDLIKQQKWTILAGDSLKLVDYNAAAFSEIYK